VTGPPRSTPRTHAHPVPVGFRAGAARQLSPYRSHDVSPWRVSAALRCACALLLHRACREELPPRASWPWHVATCTRTHTHAPRARTTRTHHAHAPRARTTRTHRAHARAPRTHHTHARAPRKHHTHACTTHARTTHTHDTHARSTHDTQHVSHAVTAKTKLSSSGPVARGGQTTLHEFRFRLLNSGTKKRSVVKPGLHT
jgi:hypothetical protein